MTVPNDFNAGSAAPAPLDLSLLELGGSSESAAPTPMDLSLLELGGSSESAAPTPLDLGGVGDSVDGAPAPVSIEELEGAAGLGQAPAPMPLDQIGQATVDHIDAPSPTEGPAGHVAEDAGADQAEATPEPMTIDQLAKLERGG